MRILDITNIAKKDSPISYREVFSGSVVYETATNEQNERKMEFTLERNAMGAVEIQIDLKEAIDYPLVPAIKSLKDYIATLEKEGKLYEC